MKLRISLSSGLDAATLKREIMAFQNAHYGDAIYVEKYLKDPKLAEFAAITSYVSHDFVSLNRAPNSALGKALISVVEKLPIVKYPVLFRVLGFTTEAERKTFLGTLNKPQKRTLTSWTLENPLAPGASAMNNIGLDLASQFGDFLCILALKDAKTARDISFAYGGDDDGTDVVLTYGATLRKAIRPVPKGPAGMDSVVVVLTQVI